LLFFGTFKTPETTTPASTYRTCTNFHSNMCEDKLTHFALCNHFVPIVTKQCQEAARRGSSCNNIRWGCLEDQFEERDFTKFCLACKNMLETRLEQAGRKPTEEEGDEEKNLDAQAETTETSNSSST
jgi:hypothetical protein